VNSTHCEINWKISEIVVFNTRFNKFELYDGGIVTFDNITEQLYVNTTNVTYLELFLVIRTNKSAPFYFPVTVNIVKFPTEKFNIKPEFKDPSGYTFNFTLDYFAYTYEIPLNVTEQFDDHNKLAWLNFSNNDFGIVKIKYD
jgi:hypothetical protein